MDCPSCGGAVPEGARFCVQCGAPLPATCAECGFANPPGARFCAGCGASLVDLSPIAAGVVARSPAAPSEAERRQLTVMFCDLVGSTALSEELDPEDLREVIASYQKCCAEHIARYEGEVAKYMGDGILAYFGYPMAHEDDAERAVRAALELVDGVGQLIPRPGLALQVRVGIATGVVVVGDLIGEGRAQEQTVVGETPNRAARLQGLATPGTVVIGGRTRRLLGGLFDFEDLGEHALKGFVEPVRAWRVVGTGKAESRFEALHGRHLIPLVGREEELQLLLARWRRGADGEGQVVLLSGEAGIGKSRIVQALREELAEERYTPLSHYCSPYHSASALYPILGLLERAAGFTRDEPSEAKLNKLEALLAQGTERLTEAVALIADVLGIAVGERYPLPNLSPQRKAQRTLEVLVEQVEGLASRQPVLALYEDVHWVDPSTLEALGLLIERVQRLPVLVLITFRPEFVPPWSGHAHVTHLSLARLTRRHGAAIVARLAAGKALPEEVLDEIVARTDGIPLFVEELTKTVLESGLLQDAGDHYELATPLPPLAIPSTLQDSLMARLDRLAPVKEVAQIGAVIGRVFDHQLLVAVSLAPEQRLNDALAQLVASELVFRRGAPPEATYTFKHALVQEAAYNSLLRTRRQELHARIAQVMEERFTDVAANRPEVLARHLTDAGLMEKAVGYWHRAGQLAAERFAHKEASAHLKRGIQLLKTLPTTPSRTEREIQLQNALGVSLITTEGPTGEVIEAYTRARELSSQLGDRRHLYAAVWGLWFYHLMRMEYDAARRLSYELIDLAESAQDRGLLLQGHHSAWAILLYRGELQACREHVERGLALYDPREHRTHALMYGGHDPGVCARYQGALALWLLGYPDEAARMVHDAVRLSRELAQPFSEVIALNSAACIHQFRGEELAVREQAEATIAVALSQGSRQYKMAGKVLRGWAIGVGGQRDAGLAEISDALTGFRAAGAAIRRSYYLALFAEALAKAGRLKEGLHAASEGLQFAEESGERWWQADLHRLEGELQLAQSPNHAAVAEACFMRALQVAREQSARSFELRAAKSLARLWAAQGRRRDAHELLAPVYAWFTEGFDTADLKNARALLHELE